MNLRMFLIVFWLPIISIGIRNLAAKENSVVSQDITIKGKNPGGPPASVAAPAVEKPILDEVIQSLDIYNKEYKVSFPKVKPFALDKRLLGPFPGPPYLSFDPKRIRQPYDRWMFEVLSGKEMIWRIEGSGALTDRLEWNGQDSNGKITVRAGRAFKFRFTASQQGAQFSLDSETMEFSSLLFKESLGGIHLEVANSKIFVSGSAEFLDGARPFLDEMVARLGRATSAETASRFILYQQKPKSKLSQSRARLLVKYFADALVLNPARIKVDVQPLDERGDILSCELPPERGALLREE